MLRNTIWIKFIVILICMLVTSAFAQVPHYINYQGKITDAQDHDLSGNYQMMFNIYTLATGGTAVWMENHTSVDVSHGLFNVLLGALTPLNLPFDQDYYLGIKIGNDAEMQPRRRIVSVGTAYRAENANNALKLDGKSAGEFAPVIHNHDNLYYTETELKNNDGTPPNSGANRIHWNNLTGVPAGFVDGVDNESSGGDPVTSVDGLGGGTISGDVDIDGSLISGRHDAFVGDDNAVSAYATTNFSTVYANNDGSGTGVYADATSGWGVVAITSSTGTGILGRSEGGRGGEFQTGDVNSYALYAYSAGELDANPGLYVKGTAYVTGTIYSNVRSSLGNMKSSSILSPDEMMTLSGQTQLNNGEIFVSYSEALVQSLNNSTDPQSLASLQEIGREIFSSGKSVRVILTPTANCNGLYISEKSDTGFLVRELLNGSSNVSFDWLAIGVMKGHEIDNLEDRFLNMETLNVNKRPVSANNGVKNLLRDSQNR